MWGCTDSETDDSHFLTLPANECEIKADVVNKLTKIFLVQFFKNEEEINNKNRFNILCKNWGSEGNILTYNTDKSESIISKINITFNEIENDISKKESIILFPECIFPYNIISTLIDFTNKNEIVIAGGFEHIKVFNFIEEITELKSKFPHLIKYLTCLEEEIKEDYKNEEYLNVSAIMWWKNYIVFQIKNNPAKLGSDKWEGIQTRKKQIYQIIKTPIGKVSCFICRDFLVNHNVLPKWMDIHDVKILLIPSFTSRVVPFLNRLKQITSYKSNSEKIFIYTNLAEYAGSDVINFSNRMKYEPTQESYHKREEGIFIFDILEMKRKEENKEIYNPEFKKLK